ncbi:MAG: hypothetical protein LUC38_00280 [Oscillospiraceae bacterium]|nr:hypothetical protein [Ruminococcus sp.]MCD8344392.1 hypothetical protein [Oscillospiraceae bacterium]
MKNNYFGRLPERQATEMLFSGKVAGLPEKSFGKVAFLYKKSFEKMAFFFQNSLEKVAGVVYNRCRAKLGGNRHAQKKD